VSNVNTSIFAHTVYSLRILLNTFGTMVGKFRREAFALLCHRTQMVLNTRYLQALFEAIPNLGIMYSMIQKCVLKYHNMNLLPGIFLHLGLNVIYCFLKGSARKGLMAFNS